MKGTKSSAFAHSDYRLHWTNRLLKTAEQIANINLSRPRHATSSRPKFSFVLTLHHLVLCVWSSTFRNWGAGFRGWGVGLRVEG